MSFVGLVNRKDVQTGLTLRAKIVSPNNKKYTTQDFKCMVKAVGMSNLACCIADLNETISGINSKNPGNLSTSLASVMPKMGTHGTNITYQFETEGEIPILDYISEDGILKKRPDYGSTSVIGNISVTVEKGTDNVQSKITLMIAPYTIDEIFENAQKTITWDTIRGANASEANDASSGMKNVKEPLNLINAIMVDGSNMPLNVSWFIDDSIEGFSESQNIYKGTRISSTGEIIRPSYSDAYRIYSVGNATYNTTIVSGTVPCIRIGGIKLTATMSLSGTEKTVKKDFVLCTLSKYLTNSEVANYLYNTIRAKVVNTNNAYSPMDSSTTNSILLQESEDNEIYQISIPTNTVGFGSAPSLGLNSISASVSCGIMQFADASVAQTYDPSITEGPVVNSDTGMTTITMHLDKAKSLSASDKKFSIMCSIDVWAYSANGITLGGESSTNKAYWKFEMATK